MDIDDLLTIGGFTFSGVGFLISLLALRQGRKLAIVTAIIAVVVVTTGILLYHSQRHDTLIRQVKKEIVETLADNTLSFDELHEHLLFRSFPVANEALFHLIESGAIRHRLVRSQVEGKLASVRVYYVPVQK